MTGQRGRGGWCPIEGEYHQGRMDCTSSLEVYIGNIASRFYQGSGQDGQECFGRYMMLDLSQRGSPGPCEGARWRDGTVHLVTEVDLLRMMQEECGAEPSSQRNDE